MQQITNDVPVIVQKTVHFVQIQKINLQASGTYKNQHYRPLTLLPTSESLQDLGRQADMANGQIQKMDLSGFAAQSLRPSTNTIGMVNIPNGWDTERFTFELVAHITTSHGVTEERLVGWSERKDTSFSGLPDPEMYFYVNTVTRRRMEQRHGMGGSHIVGTFQDSSQVFFEPVLTNMFNSETTPKLVRPYDLYGRLAVNDLDPTSSWSKELGVTGMGGVPATVFDSRGSLNGVPETSRRSNALITNYLTRTLGAYSTANMARNNDMLDDAYSATESVFSRARMDPSINEIAVSESDFLTRLKNLRPGSMAIEPKFTLSELYALDPVLAQSSDTRLQINQQSLSTNLFSASNWSDETEQAIMATYVGQAIPAIMARCGSLGLVVTMQNQSATDPLVHIGGHLLTLPEAIPVIEKAIEVEIMPILTAFNKRSAWVRYQSGGANHHAQVAIILAGQPMEVFDIPQFADSRFSSVISNESGASNMAMRLNATLQRVGVAPSTNFGQEFNLMDLNKAISAENHQAKQLQQAEVSQALAQAGQQLTPNIQLSSPMNLNSGSTLSMPVAGGTTRLI